MIANAIDETRPPQRSENFGLSRGEGFISMIYSDI